MWIMSDINCVLIILYVMIVVVVHQLCPNSVTEINFTMLAKDGWSLHIELNLSMIEIFVSMP